MQKVKLSPSGRGFDAMSGELVDMFTAGIVETLKVARSALRNAASIGSLIETLIADKPEPKPANGGGAPGGMRGSYAMMYSRKQITSVANPFQ